MRNPQNPRMEGGRVALRALYCAPLLLKLAPKGEHSSRVGQRLGKLFEAGQQSLDTADLTYLEVAKDRGNLLIWCISTIPGGTNQAGQWPFDQGAINAAASIGAGQGPVWLSKRVFHMLLGQTIRHCIFSCLGKEKKSRTHIVG